MCRVSVIIPCYNCEKFVMETIDSVMKQTYFDFEIIAINDCSKDKTMDILVECEKVNDKLRVYSNEVNLGVALTRNKGVELAKGEYIAFVDSDDVWLESKLEKQIELMESDTEIDMTFTAYDLYDESMQNKLKTYSIPVDVNYEMLLYENIVGLSTVVMKKSVFNEFKMNKDYMHEDYVLWLKLLKNNYKLKGINSSLVKYRVFNDSRNANKFRALSERVKILYKEEGLSPIMILKYILVYGVKGLMKYR